MRKPSPSLHDRISVRAYYLTLNTGADALTAWLSAEAHEMRLLRRRQQAATCKASLAPAAPSNVVLMSGRLVKISSAA